MYTNQSSVTILRGCLPTPPLTHHFVLSKKLMLTLGQGRGRRTTEFCIYFCSQVNELRSAENLIASRSYLQLKLAAVLRGGEREQLLRHRSKSSNKRFNRNFARLSPFL